MYIDKKKLFLVMLGVTVVLTLAFGVGLAYDVAYYRNGNTSTTVLGGNVNALATPDSGTSTDNGTGATPGSEGSGHAGGTGGSLGRVGGSTGSAAGPTLNPANNATIGANDTIRIGALMTLSGPGNVTDGMHAEQAYIQYINSQGGINGHKLELDVQDDQGNPAVGRPRFQQIVQEDKVFAVVGECAPITDGTIVDLINTYQVPIVNDCLTSDAGYASKYIWYSFLPPRTYMPLVANFLTTHQSLAHIKKPYVLCLDQATVLPYCDSFVAKWQQLGGTTCSQGKCAGGYEKEHLLTTRSEFDRVALEIRQSGADSIVSGLEPSNQLAFMQALQDQHMGPTQGFPQYAMIGMDQYVEQTMGDFAKGVMVSGFTYWLDEAQFPGIAQMRDVMQKFSPDTPIDTYVQAEWNPMVIFVEALRRMGNNITRANLIATLNSMGDFSDGQQKPLGWSASNHIAPMYTRYALTAGPSQFQPVTGWIDPNGNPSS